jgi:steroid delta-isomerase-like uncharacterized protein
MSTEINKQKARAFFDHADRGDMAAWRAALAPDAVAQVNGDPEMSVEQFEGMASVFFKAFSNGRHIIESQMADGDWVATRMFWTAVHSDAFNGIPASNRPVRIASVACDRFQGGKIAEHRTTIDVMALLTQIGAIPAAA